MGKVGSWWWECVLEADPIVADQEAGSESQESMVMYHLHKPISKVMYLVSRLLKVLTFPSSQI